MSFASSFENLASNLAGRFGTTATYIAEGTATYDASTGAATATETRSTVTVVIMEARLKSEGSPGEIDGRGASIFMAAKGNPTPKLGDSILLPDGMSYVIEGIVPEYAQGTPVGYTLECER